MKYYVIVARPEDGSVLVLPSSNGCTVPSFTPDTTDARIVERINAEIHRQLGFEVWTLKCAARGEDNGKPWRIFIARRPRVRRIPSFRLTSGWSAEALCRLTLQIRQSRKSVRAWYADLDSPSELRAPWEAFGWHDAACEWISAHLSSLGFTIQDPIVQQRAWGLSCTIKVGTEKGDVYFKATPPFMAHEGRAMQVIAERCPKLLPSPLAIDPERGWVLMRDYGGEMLHECPDITRWEEALHLFSQSQVEQVEPVQQWLSLNIPRQATGSHGCDDRPADCLLLTDAHGRCQRSVRI